MKPDFIARNPALIEALGIVVDREFDQIPILDEFSPEFERKMEQLIRAERRPYYRFTNTHAKKALLALAATFILFVTMVFSVSAIRQPFIRFVVETFEKFSSILFHTDDADVQLPTTIEQNFLPHWLPKGYVLDETNNLKTDLYCFHAFNKGDVTISFEQYVITSIQLQVDTEGVDQSDINVRGYPGITYSNKDIQNIVWNNGQYGFTLAGPIPLEDLLRIAESLREK